MVDFCSGEQLAHHVLLLPEIVQELPYKQLGISAQRFAQKQRKELSSNLCVDGFVGIYLEVSNIVL